MAGKVYRVFKSREFAERFLAGEIRFGSLEYYRGVEDGGRGDRTEGHGLHREYRKDRKAVRLSPAGAEEFVSPGDVSVHSEVGNHVYVCCLTQPPDEAAWKQVRADFGEFVVEIDDAERLQQNVQASG